MTSMIEKAARALADYYATGEGPFGIKTNEGAARAVLQAIREPDEAMIEAGNDIEGEIFPRDCWQAMIDSILNPQDTSGSK